MWKQQRPLVLLLGFICALGFGGMRCHGEESPPSVPEFNSKKLGEIRGKLQAFVDDHQIAGAVAVVGTASGIVGYESVGWRNIEKQQPMTKESLFRIASMTKPITAIGVMILADEGK